MPCTTTIGAIDNALPPSTPGPRAGGPPSHINAGNRDVTVGTICPGHICLGLGDRSVVVDIPISQPASADDDRCWCGHTGDTVGGGKSGDPVPIHLEVGGERR